MAYWRSLNVRPGGQDKLFSLRLFMIMALGLVALALGVAACGGDDDASAPAAAEPASEPAPDPAPEPAPDSAPAEPSGEPIVIGEVKAFSGFMEIFDQPPLRAAEFAVADINAAGGILGRPVELITGDYATKIEDVVPAAQDLLDQGADFLIVACDFDFGAPAASLAAESNILAFSDCAGSVQFGPQGIGPLAYTMGASCRTEGAIGAEFANEDKGATRAFVLRDPSFLYYDECTTGFKDRFTELGGEIVGEEIFQADDPTIATQLAALHAVSPPPDVIALYGIPTGGAAAMRQLRAAGFDQPIVSSLSYDSTGWEEAVPDLSDLYYTAPAAMDGSDPTPAVNDFFARYQETFGELPTSSLALLGYSTVEAFKIAAETANSLDGDKLAEALDSLGPLDILVGETEYDENTHFVLTRPMAIMQHQNGVKSLLEYRAVKTPPKLPF